MDTKFDYIIIGAGSSGCVLANRLTENGKDRVCLIEAGPYENKALYRIPLGGGAIIMSKRLNWHFQSTAQKYCNNRKIWLPAGRTFGGTSAFNGMLYVRGHSSDYDHWAALGNPGWSYQEVLPYFKKLENFSGNIDEYHHKGGPLGIAGSLCINPLAKVFIQAAQDAGHSYTADFNGAQQEGVGYYQVTQENGQRCSNAHAYFDKIKNRSNLTFLTEARVIEILFADKKAIGVKYIHQGLTKDIFCQKEVLLSAGTYMSPQLLLLSGIGPSTELNQYGISVRQHLPGVGKNFQDHLDIALCYLEKTRHAICFHPYSFFRLLTNLIQYFVAKKGEFTSVLSQTGGFIKSNPNEPIPDLQWHFTPCVYARIDKVERMRQYYGLTMLTCFLHPFSRGEITLSSADPMAYPNINPNYLSDERDIEPLIIGFKKARAVFQQRAFDPYRLNEFIPGEGVQTDDEIRAYIRQEAEPDYHPVGTCKMGNDAMAVVDSRLRVHGIAGLRVIDASIIPVIVTGNTLGPATMIAEKAADMILADNS